MFPEQTLIQKARKYLLENMEAHSIHLVVIYSSIWFCGALVGTICGFVFGFFPASRCSRKITGWSMK